MYSDVFQVGRYYAKVSMFNRALIAKVADMYPIATNVIADFDVRIERHRWYKPQARFNFNGSYPFTPLPAGHAYPLLEWSLNWCVSQHAHQFLIIHAAVIEKHGKAIILPGSPGSGKSTLSALMHTQDDWRLLSDELALIDLNRNLVHPNPRPVSLKNQSIPLLKQMAPNFMLSDAVHDTLKGTVAHLKPSEYAYDNAFKPAEITSVVFPTFDANSNSNQLEAMTCGESFMKLMNNSFNYHVLREKGFTALARAVNSAKHYSYINNGHLDTSIRHFNEMIAL